MIRIDDSADKVPEIVVMEHPALENTRLSLSLKYSIVGDGFFLFLIWFHPE